MSKGFKLAVLLKDVAERPEVQKPPIPSDILRDVAIPPRQTSWQEHWRKMVAAGVVGLIALGTLFALLPDFSTAVKSFVQGHASTAALTPTHRIIDPQQNEPPPSGLDPTAFSKPVQELMAYVQCLRKTACDFNWGITGEESAKQFGYSRLFASDYDEMVGRTRARGRDQKRPRRTDIAVDFEGIVLEEQTIDQLLARKERHAAAIAYLRALQNGDVAFPNPQTTAPVPQALLVQLMVAYPDVVFDINDGVFAAVYRATREFMLTRLTQAGEIAVYDVTGDFRRFILRSVATPENELPTAVCKKAQTLGHLVGISQACPRLRPTEAEEKGTEALIRQPDAIDCLDESAVRFKTELDMMSNGDTKSMCEWIEQQVRARKISAFYIPY